MERLSSLRRVTGEFPVFSPVFWAFLVLFAWHLNPHAGHMISDKQGHEEIHYALADSQLVPR